MHFKPWDDSYVVLQWVNILGTLRWTWLMQNEHKHIAIVIITSWMCNESTLTFLSGEFSSEVISAVSGHNAMSLKRVQLNFYLTSCRLTECWILTGQAASNKMSKTSVLGIKVIKTPPSTGTPLQRFLDTLPKMAEEHGCFIIEFQSLWQEMTSDDN